MNIDTILISEYASGDRDGRLTVVNAFNRFFGPGPAWAKPIIYLTTVAHGPRREAGKSWKGEIRIINEKRELVTDEPFEADSGLCGTTGDSRHRFGHRH